jgi:osmotically-inducible protein OsmY
MDFADKPRKVGWERSLEELSTDPRPVITSYKDMLTRIGNMREFDKRVLFALTGFVFILGCGLLSGCIGNLWTGASLVYDRHNIYKKISDFQLATNISHALSKDKLVRCAECSVDIAVFNGDVLLSGHVPSQQLRQEVDERVKGITGYRRLFNQLAIHQFSDTSLSDEWITTKIRSEIFADADIDPHSFKVVTSDRIVYLMGDVVPKEAERVIHMASGCKDVRRVVKLFKYYNLSDKAETLK